MCVWWCVVWCVPLAGRDGSERGEETRHHGASQSLSSLTSPWVHSTTATPHHHHTNGPRHPAKERVRRKRQLGQPTRPRKDTTTHDHLFFLPVSGAVVPRAVQMQGWKEQCNKRSPSRQISLLVDTLFPSTRSIVDEGQREAKKRDRGIAELGGKQQQHAPGAPLSRRSADPPLACRLAKKERSYVSSTEMKVILSAVVWLFT